LRAVAAPPLTKLTLIRTTTAARQAHLSCSSMPMGPIGTDLHMEVDEFSK
jgi:hypothetical protein